MNKKILIAFCLLVAIKIALAFLMPIPLGFSDSLTHIEGAKAFFENPSIESSIITEKYIIYPIVTSLAFLVDDMGLVLLIILILNAFLSSLILFPAYWFAREFLKDNDASSTAILIGILPTTFPYTLYIFSENIYLPLVLLTMYFLYKALHHETLGWHILTGVACALAFLAKSQGLFIILTASILSSIAIARNKTWKVVRNKMIFAGACFMVLLPWIVAKGEKYGWSLGGMLGYSNEVHIASTNIWTKIIWVVAYTDYLLIGSSILFLAIIVMLTFQYRTLDHRIKIAVEMTVISTILLILIAANNASFFEHFTDHRIIGRYVEPVIPLIILLGIANLQTRISIRIKIGILLALALFTPIMLLKDYFPINNMSWTHIGVLKYGLNNIGSPFTSLIITTIVLALAALIFWKIPKTIKNTILLSMLFFGAVTMLNVAIILYDSNYRWAPLEEVELGKWIDANIDKDATFLLDIDDNPPQTMDDFKDRARISSDNDDQPSWLIAYWIRGDYAFDTVENYTKYNYIITTKDLDLEKVKTGKTINIYQV